MISCPTCGFANHDQAESCANCGANLAILSAFAILQGMPLDLGKLAPSSGDSASNNALDDMLRPLQPSTQPRPTPVEPVEPKREVIEAKRDVVEPKRKPLPPGLVEVEAEELFEPEMKADQIEAMLQPLQQAFLESEPITRTPPEVVIDRRPLPPGLIEIDPAEVLVEEVKTDRAVSQPQPLTSDDEKTPTLTPPRPDPIRATVPEQSSYGTSHSVVELRPRLIVIRGAKPDTEYPIYAGNNYIGRTDEKPVDIDLEDQESSDRIWTSRQHAVITFENNSLVIEDLNSLNGTFVNRTRLHPGQKRILTDNDIIQVGTVQMKVSLGD